MPISHFYSYFYFLLLEENNERALKRFAELGVDKLLDGEDVAEFPDQKSIYTYLTTYASSPFLILFFILE